MLVAGLTEPLAGLRLQLTPALSLVVAVTLSTCVTVRLAEAGEILTVVAPAPELWPLPEHAHSSAHAAAVARADRLVCHRSIPFLLPSINSEPVHIELTDVGCAGFAESVTVKAIAAPATSSVGKPASVPFDALSDRPAGKVLLDRMSEAIPPDAVSVAE
jgi:hypothetical protein